MAQSSPVHFTRKHVYSVKNNLLSGITLVPWLKILFQRFTVIEWRSYWLRVLFITTLACFNTALAALEWLLYRKAVAAAKINPRPVFILGHPRTGTTLLHNLLSLDTDQFGYASTFHCGFPSTFLLTERFKDVLSPIIDKTRPMDNMALSFDVPQEDELATNVLSAGISPYMPLVFMQQEAKCTQLTVPQPSYRRYFSFRLASLPDLQAWTDSFLFFVRKLTVRYGEAKRLLLKSPVHTARVGLLLQLFPDAQFIYIHRNPYEVFQSAVHMADTCYWYTYLNTPTDSQVLDFIINQYDTLYEDYIRDRALIPAGNLKEVTFASLESDPVGQITAIYDHFHWPCPPALVARLRAHCSSIEGFKKNSFVTLSDDARALVAKRWRPSFDMFGYKV